ncbi:MAG TPA: MogA/MoaB family molybdenum cofactor biosynthesis protein [Bacillota bacterium]|nr:MogA/MoaB family molybdenum cofactor biosynthesis protein [Bacillota bacterium]
MAVGEHKGKHLNAGCMIITISDTRTAATDKSGRLIATMLEQAGHRVEAKEIVPDESRAVQTAIEKGCDHAAIDVILTNGGTGIAARDITIETVQPMLDKEISGFGELFRMLSYAEDIGSAALMSRAVAGIKNDTAIFSMPGSSGAVKLAMQKLIMPELSHIVYELRKDLGN